MNNPLETNTQNRIGSQDAADATVPLRLLRQFEHESLRWPPRLHRDAIIERLVTIREFAPSYRNGLEEVSRLLEDVENLSPAQLGGRVLSILEWTSVNPGHEFLANQLQIVALNLKNLQQD